MNLNIIENYVALVELGNSKPGYYMIVETEYEATALAVSKNVLSEIENRIIELESSNIALKTQNESLLRINRSRTNKERDLRPRKTHTGYTIVFSNPIERTFRIYGGNKKCYMYETVFITPYLITMPLEHVKSFIEKDLNRIIVNNEPFIKTLGCDLYRPTSDYKKVIEEDIPIAQKEYYDKLIEEYEKDGSCCDYFKKDEFKKISIEMQPNVFFGVNYRMNGKCGYWELIMYHLEPCKINELMMHNIKDS